jgi:hypothetical protein
MLKQKRNIFISLLLIALCLFFTGCGASSDTSYNDNLTHNSIFENSDISKGDIESGMSDIVQDSATGSNSNNKVETTTKQKIIKKYYYDVETTDFDTTVSKLEEAIRDNNGYIETSNIRGNQTYYKNTRFAEYTIRIPVKESDKFVDYINQNHIVTNKKINTEDVTTQYVDIESRLKALKSEKLALETLLNNAKNMSDIIAIRNQLTDVIYEIESFESKLRTYDNLIDYTTIYLTIDEVETPTVVEEQTVWQEIGDKFTHNFKDVIDALVNFFIFIVSSIPYFLLIALFVVPTILIIKRIIKKKRNKKNKNKTSQQTDKKTISEETK